MVTLIMIALALILSGCGAARVATESSSSDSVRVETHYIEVVKIDTICVEIPHQSASRETRDTISHLENDFALSDARVTSDGVLHHSLETKKSSIPVPTENKTIRKDSIIYRDRNVYLTNTEYVERELTSWQKWQMRSFWILLSVILAALVYRFRKPIWAIVRRFI